MQRCTSCHAGRTFVELSNGEKLCKPNACTCDFPPSHSHTSKKVWNSAGHFDELGQVRVATYAASIGNASLCPTNNRSIGDVCPASTLSKQDQDYTRPPPPPPTQQPTLSPTANPTTPNPTANPIANPTKKACSACSVAECTFGKLCGPNPYVCTAGVTKRGCHKEPSFWPGPHSGCDKCCNAADCEAHT